MKRNDIGFVFIILLATFFMSGCQEDNQEKSMLNADGSQGQMRVALVAATASGNVYRLRDGIFDIVGKNTATSVSVSSEDNLEEEAIEVLLPPDGYSIFLNDGYRLERIDTTSNSFLNVEMTSENPMFAEVTMDAATDVNFEFVVNGEPVLPGLLTIGISVKESKCEASCEDGNVCTIDWCDPDTGCMHENDTENCTCIECGCFPKIAELRDTVTYNANGSYEWDMSNCDYLEAEGFIVAGGGDGGKGGYSYVCESGGGGGGGGAGEVASFGRQILTPGIFNFSIGSAGYDSFMSGPDFELLTARHGDDGKNASGPDKGNSGNGYPSGKNGDDGTVACGGVAGGKGGNGGDNTTSYGHGGKGGHGASSGKENYEYGDDGSSGGAEIRYFCWTCPSITNKPAW